MIAQFNANILSPMRFDGAKPITFRELIAGVVPYPRIHFPLPSHSKFVTQDHSAIDNDNMNDMVASLFENSTQLTCIKNIKRDSYTMTAHMTYRGFDPSELKNTIGAVNRL
jgi:hypothetical protein